MRQPLRFDVDTYQLLRKRLPAAAARRDRALLRLEEGPWRADRRLRA